MSRHLSPAKRLLAASLVAGLAVGMPVVAEPKGNRSDRAFAEMLGGGDDPLKRATKRSRAMQRLADIGARWVPVTTTSKRLLRRELTRFLAAQGQSLSGRQWVKWRKARLRSARAA